MKSKAPTQNKIEKLPRRAAVAYVARCARRVLPLCDIRIFRYANAAIRYTEQTATGIHIESGLHSHSSLPTEERVLGELNFSKELKPYDAPGAAQNSALSALRAALAYKDYVYSDYRTGERVETHSYDSLYREAFAAFDYADFAAAAVANFNAQEVYQCPAIVDSAGCDSTADAEYESIYRVVRNAMAADFLALHTECEKKKWNNSARIPVEVFGDWWPYGTPRAWPVTYDYPHSLNALRSRSSVFLSHTGKDKPYARRLAKDLEKEGVRVWLDEAEIQIGDSLIEKIREGIDSMEYLSVILTSDSVRSEWVKREVDIAMNQEIAGKRVKVLPLLFEQCDLPGFLEGKAYADFTDPEGYRRALKKLLQRLGVELPDNFENKDRG